MLIQINSCLANGPVRDQPLSKLRYRAASLRDAWFNDAALFKVRNESTDTVHIFLGNPTTISTDKALAAVICKIDERQCIESLNLKVLNVSPLTKVANRRGVAVNSQGRKAIIG